ncbi:O-antigen ligase family protein [Methylobacterium currus]|uniref:O-antigen ligase family protein n=1 Tax=Methylobacterium currus TaxID=2051553 RepID=UPI001E3132B1|nr:O-antigen ligase family protein [Methylobacterium currus]UHC17904.1 O-antigen ligase family protein [Methylobacterium currus]
MLIIGCAVLILIAWFWGARRFVEAVLLTRSFCDPLFTLSKLDDLGGMGLGAAVNLAAIAVAIGCMVSHPRVNIAPVARLWLPFLMVCLVAVPFSPDTSAAFRLFLVLVSHAAFCLLPFYVVRSIDDLRHFLLIIVAGSLVPTLLAMMQLAFGWAQWEDGTRVQATFTHPNIYAFYLMVVLAVVFVLLAGRGLRLTRRTRNLLTLYVPVLLGLMLMTKTRSAWAGTALIFMTYALLFDRRNLLYLLGLPLLAVVMPELVERIADLNQGNSRDTYAALNSYAFRVLLWESAFTWIWERPVFGWGLVGFAHYVAQFFPLALENDTIDSHSVFVQLLFETGVIGLLAFLWIYLILISLLINLIRLRARWAYISLALVVGYLSMSYSDNMLGYLVPTWYMWFMFGSSYAILRIYKLARAGPEPLETDLRVAR